MKRDIKAYIFIFLLSEEDLMMQSPWQFGFVLHAMHWLCGIPDFVFQTQTICFMTCHWLPLQHYLMPLFPLLFLDAPATLAFFLCLTLSRLFASKSLSCCFLWGKCLFDVLTGLDPSQYSYLSPKFSESSFLNSQSNLLSCPATNPSIMGGFGVFLFCFAFTLIKNSLLLKF